ncbi:unnamed protein product [Schistosoma mattheei]|uniref:Uncharacterized protein n=1 Tax=Schistosoma mattheei TaxID=31246 RepID=A0A3P8IH57_9TREM|nr:unnamed protein product [Schistosoma mattheei]
MAGGTEEDFILLDKLLEDRISEDPDAIIEPSTFQHTENVKPNDNIVQSSDIQEGPFDKEKFDASTMKKRLIKENHKTVFVGVYQYELTAVRRVIGFRSYKCSSDKHNSSKLAQYF